ncbi:MAG TPA: bi-domain-containing oxidoreductase [Acidimicrobiales bacterium]|nr:bi-domain-containing oxidoreductase [Acidimicrobiales bacterium]
MKQVAQNYRSGELHVLDVPAPSCEPGGVLVRTLFSLISTGTEMMKVSESKMSLVGMARARPDQVRKVLDTARQQGPMTAYRKAMGRLDSYTPLGYSLAGVVTAVGAGVEGISEGQLVACAGNEFAFHAEVNWVPKNLCVPVPAGVEARHAAFATVGAIAMQGVRQGEVQLGDVACVIGLGLVGQLVVRLLVAAGVAVVGVDVRPERCELAMRGGARACAGTSPADLDAVESAVRRASGGLGADRIFLAAGGPSNAPVELAARLARDRARVVDIGKCKLDLPWTDYYDKELEVRFSRSYGPGRYDPVYEVGGVDYPAGYVRWTEQRNLGCFLDLVAHGGLDIAELVSGVFPVVDAVSVYERLAAGDLEGIGFLFAYPEGPARADTGVVAGAGATAGGADGVNANGARPDGANANGASANGAGANGANANGAGAHGASAHGANGNGAGAKAAKGTGASRAAPRRIGPGGTVRVAFIGAGNYATSMLLPHLAADAGVELATVVTRSALSAVNAQRKFGFATTATDRSAVLEDERVDAVFIATRHSSHARLACEALRAGKAVFVEKPLALDQAGLDSVLATVAETGNDRLMVGFNRRFAPMFRTLRTAFGSARGPLVLRYLVNAGPLGAKSWYAERATEGSRFAGEGGHFVDVLSWWTGAEPTEVRAVGAEGGEDLHVTLRYDDGSLGLIDYLVGGHPRFPKETFEVFGGGRSACMDNFRRAQVWTGRRAPVVRAWRGPDKGQAGELSAFVEAVRAGTPMPIPLASLEATTRATLLAVAGGGRAERDRAEAEALPAEPVGSER